MLIIRRDWKWIVWYERRSQTHGLDHYLITGCFFHSWFSLLTNFLAPCFVSSFNYIIGSIKFHASTKTVKLVETYLEYVSSNDYDWRVINFNYHDKIRLPPSPQKCPINFIHATVITLAHNSSDNYEIQCRHTLIVLILIISYITQSILQYNLIKV